MKRNIIMIVVFYMIAGTIQSILAQTSSFSQNALQEDFLQFRDLLENEHCCLYEYTSRAEMDSLFDTHYKLIDHEMGRDAFFKLLAPITAKIGCMHTATWMPGRFFISKPTMLFPLTVKLLVEQVIVTGSYLEFLEVPRGSMIIEINQKPVAEIIEQMRKITSADALNPYFVDAQWTRRFAMFYASVYGLPDQYEIKYLPTELSKPIVKKLTPADDASVRKVVFAHFNSPPLHFQINEDKSTAIMTVSTFIYYDKVDYFNTFMDSCFQLIAEKKIKNLILDVRRNGGGDPFCASILYTYLLHKPAPYFAEPYGKYDRLAVPLDLPENHFTGNLYTLIDGSCGSTNGHFCALLKYHKLGKFIGTPSGATYKCNAGRNTEFRLKNTQMIITIGRSTFAAAVQDMDKTAIIPDIFVHETLDDFHENRDVFIEKAYEQIEEQYAH